MADAEEASENEEQLGEQGDDVDIARNGSKEVLPLDADAAAEEA